MTGTERMRPGTMPLAAWRRGFEGAAVALDPTCHAAVEASAETVVTCLSYQLKPKKMVPLAGSGYSDYAGDKACSICSKLLFGIASAFIQELTERKYADPLVYPQIQHCPIAGYNDVGASPHGALEDAVVRLVV